MVRVTDTSTYSLRVAYLELALVTLGMYRMVRYHVVTDDAFIYFRYAENILLGNGIVYNVGQYVEGYTSVMWLVLLCCGRLITQHYLVICFILGTASGLLLFWLVADTQRNVCYKEGTIAYYSPYSLALLVGWPPICHYMQCGLETPLVMVFCALLGRGIMLGNRSRVFWASIGASSFLIRPELIMLPLALSVIFYFRDDKRVSFVLLASALLTVAVLTVLRIYYFSTLLPNTGYVKSGLSFDYWKGIDYYIRSSVYGYPWIWLGVLATVIIGKIRTERLVLLALAALFTLWTLGVSDYFSGRFSVVPMILVAMAAGGLLERIALKSGSRGDAFQRLVIKVVVVSAAFCFSSVHSPLERLDISVRNTAGYAADWHTGMALPTFWPPLRIIPSPDELIWLQLSQTLDLGRNLIVIQHPIRREFFSTSAVSFIHPFALTDNVSSRVDRTDYLPGHEKSPFNIFPSLYLQKVDFIEWGFFHDKCRWLSLLEIELWAEVSGRHTTVRVVPMNFDDEIISKLHLISSSSISDLKNKCSRLVDFALSTTDTDARCSAIFFLLEKCKPLLKQQDVDVLLERFGNEGCCNKGHAGWLQTNAPLIRPLLIQQTGTGTFAEKLLLALKCHFIKIPPEDDDWTAGTGLSVTSPV